MRPRAIIEQLDLLAPIYLKTAAYGHFGRKEFSWEKTDRAAEIAADLGPKKSATRSTSNGKAKAIGASKPAIKKSASKPASKPASKKSASKPASKPASKKSASKKPASKKPASKPSRARA
jgi:S-adenosylmethionine synthetase